MNYYSSYYLSRDVITHVIYVDILSRAHAVALLGSSSGHH